MMGLDISVLRNKWLLLCLGVVYVAVIWGVFVVVNHQEHVRGELTRSPETLQKTTVMEMYDSFKQKESWVQNKMVLLRLSEALIHQGKIRAAQEVSEEALRLDPSDHELRLQLALALHNAGYYEEAESHFTILLQERGEK